MTLRRDNRGWGLAGAAGVLGFVCGFARGADNPQTWTDFAGDVLLRATDPNLTGVPGPGCNLPNLLKLSVGGWQSPTPSTNPYSGSYVNPESAHLLRFDLEFKGVVNPPGSASLSNYNPFQFGPSPVLGAIEFDIDSDRDTGGELGAAAKGRYLANIARFGRLPYGSIGSRVVKLGWQADAVFSTSPQFERSGADFVLAFCGCYTTTILSETGNKNHIFESGETWIIRGGFFQRSGGYQLSCQSTGGAAGLQVGLYVPFVNLRWLHDPSIDRTIVTLVFPSTQTGAGQLAGQPAEPLDLNVSNQTSMVEAIWDLVNNCSGAPNGSPSQTLSQRWQGRNALDSRYREPDRWTATALIGTAMSEPVDGAVLIWTDSGFNEVQRDLDGDLITSTSDKMVIWTTIDALDGTNWDAGGNGVEDGGVILANPGINFALADVDGDGSINRLDVYSLCPGDFNKDGVVNLIDYIRFFDAFYAGELSADMNSNGLLDAGDFMVFMNAAAGGC